MKAATLSVIRNRNIEGISIHAAREGGDLPVRVLFVSHFISIHAAREGGDVVAQYIISNCSISIHAAREGGDEVVA